MINLKTPFTPLESPDQLGGDEKRRVLFVLKREGFKTPPFLKGFIASILFHSIALFSIAAFYQPVREAIMDITPLEIIQRPDAEDVPRLKEKKPKEIALPKKAEPVPLPQKMEEPVKEMPSPPLKQKIAEIESAPVSPPLPAVEDTVAAPAVEINSKSKDSDSPYAVQDGKGLSTYDEMSLFKAMIFNKIERAKFYPRWARERGYEGVVGVQFVILPDGKVGSVKVVRPCHCEILNKAACEAIMKAAPFPMSGKMEDKEMAMEIDIGFKLE